MPSGIPFIVANEAAERFSFYGMRTILVVFMTKYLVDAAGQPAGMTDAAANSVFHLFVGAVYFFPIFGALLADWVLGKYRVIMALSVVYCAGHFVLALMDLPGIGIAPRQLLYVGLGLIAVGAGGIKPCVSAHVGDQFGSRNAHLLERVFGWFYFSINLGAVVSTALTPVLLADERFGPAYAFGLPGVLMLIATIAFWLGRHRYAHIPPSGDRVAAEWRAGGGAAVLRLLPLFAFIIAFWMLFDQTGSAWVLQADRMDQQIGQRVVLPSQMQLVNPALVLMLIPLFSYVVYPQVGRVVTLTPLRKIGAGLVLAGGSFFVSGAIERMIAASPDAPPHILWQTVPYFLLTSAELLVSVTSLEFVYSQAPRSMKSILMGVYFLSITAANFLVSGLNAWIDGVRKGGRDDFLTGASYYDLFGLVAVASGIGFAVWATTYRSRTVLQDDASPAEA